MSEPVRRDSPARRPADPVVAAGSTQPAEPATDVDRTGAGIQADVVAAARGNTIPVDAIAAAARGNTIPVDAIAAAARGADETTPALGSRPPAIDDAIDARRTAEAVLYEIRRVIVGQDAMLERVLVALLSGGHLLLEGVPGLAKTLTIKTLADVLHASFRRIQFTPDLVPGDLVGTRIYRPDRGIFDTELGPVFCNFLLADEINRAPAKVQSALLEVMQERQVTIGPESHPVPRPFLVMATQNPIESEGTYPLPEAQVDRFMMKVVVGYPSAEEEALVVERSLRPASPVLPILTAESLAALQALTADVYVDRPIVDYAVALTAATRHPERVGLPAVKPYIAFGASPRGSINLIHAARALALVRGRRYVIPGDVVDLARDVLRHRIVPSFTSLAEEVTADMILDRLIDAVPVPRVAHDGLLARAEAADRTTLVASARLNPRAETFDRADARSFDRADALDAGGTFGRVDEERSA